MAERKESLVFIALVDGEELGRIAMTPLKQDTTYSDHLSKYAGGYISNKEHTKALYHYSIRVERRKTPEEEDKDASP